MRPAAPGWRSLLFTPGDAPDKLARAGCRGADAVIIDLEDAVPAARKAQARAGLPAAVGALAAAGQPVAVRINVGRDAALDLDAAVRAGVCAIVAPKAERRADLEDLARRIEVLEAARALPPGGLALIALVESPAGVLAAADLAAAPRVAGLALGTEDFAAAMGVEPTPGVLDLPCRLLALAAAARGIMALGAPLSLAEFRDRAALERAATSAREMGMTGALCIHPIQAAVANTAFAVSLEAYAQAVRILEAWRAHRAAGVFELDGRMVDAPVARRAEAVLEQADRHYR